MKSDKIKGIIYLLITAIIWGGTFISQLLGGTVLGSFTFSAYRSILGCITIAIMIICDNFIKYKKIMFFRDDEDVILTIKNSFICGLVLFLSLITQQLGVENTDTAKSGLIASLEAIMVPIILWIFFKRKIKLITWGFIFTSMFGIMMLSMNSISGINIGDVLVFISSIFYSISIIQVPMYIKNVDMYKFSFFRFFVVMIFSVILSFVFRQDPLNFANVKLAALSIFFSGVLASGIAYTFQVIGQKHCEPIIATLIMSLEGPFAAIFGWIILGQALNLLQILGILIAFGSIVMVQITDV